MRKKLNHTSTFFYFILEKYVVQQLQLIAKSFGCPKVSAIKYQSLSSNLENQKRRGVFVFNYF